MYSMQEYANRRQRLLARMQPNSILLLPAASQRWRTMGVEYPFRQESNFYYLTGIQDSDAILLLLKLGDHSVQSIVFLKTYTPEEELWNGAQLSLSEACQQYGIEAYPLSEFEAKIGTFFLEKNMIYYGFGNQEKLDKLVINILKTLRHKKSQERYLPDLKDPYPWIYEMRLRKSAMEIALLRKSSDLSAAAHLQLMQYCQPGLMEYQMEAKFTYACREAGCHALAYNSIVGGGKNACTLHYIRNNKRLEAGDLVLVDAGGEYEGYASDITRTYPVNGQFSATQRALYEVVLHAQCLAIELVKPGLHWNQLQDCIVHALVEGLKELKILQGDTQTLIEKKAYLPFYMHSSGHWLGLDVHDPSEYQQQGAWRILEPNMVFTIEPGLYIRPSPDVDEKWWNIGIRVEDDILVTEMGYEILTIQAPKSILDIEYVMRK